MKVHYINILLFSLPLNILEHNPWNHYMKPHTYTNRSLCECELYELANYDNDPQMKEVMENFNKQTQQRFHEYDERMKTTRQKCKDKCDKEIQKIILKDKLEKQMAQQLTTLDPNITTEDIPTCICEKSLADKVEKGCLRCGYGLGTVAPTVGLIGAVAVHQWTNAALLDAAQKGIEAGIEAAIKGFKLKFGLETISGVPLNTVLNANNFKHPMILGQIVQGEYNTVCGVDPNNTSVLCFYTRQTYAQTYSMIATNAQTVATDAGKAAATAEAAQIASVNAESAHLYSAIGYSVTAILIIVLVMVIIYLILRYRRKKKMKKKLQYIKLLKE
ncbi:rifin [Plasmodium falciparum Dd2]|uniref:Rifin n=1 Tax=Plasmodium falciparum (isolate Dd2) TaxID=57267 RepID=A0A0L7M5W5_PLAF4|nr:rifin [Plasmodium falciparum Dd2]